MIIIAANCKLTKGRNRTCINDLQNKHFYIVPNSVYEYIKNKKAISDLDNQSQLIVKELFNLDILLEIDDNLVEQFSDISYEFDYPATIANCILDYGKSLKENIVEVTESLENFNCKHLEVRFFNTYDFDFLNHLNVLLMSSTIETIDLYLPFTTDTTFLDRLLKLKLNSLRFRWIFIHSAPENVETQTKFGTTLRYTTQRIADESHCGNIHRFYFTSNISFFTESQHHNTCLNRKISIDEDGFIKNCPSMKHHFGHISDTKLEEVIKNPEFTKYWNIKKDDITKCKDCEFRHICTDCRAYIENPDDLYSAPLKCGYNPYTCEWEEWSTNPLKHKAMEHYGFPVSSKDLGTPSVK